MLRIGATGFGGPLVTMGLMRDSCVKKYNWITEKEFLERMGMVKLLPGPVSSLMAIALGRKFFGFWGSLGSLIAFILPAFLIVMLWNFAEKSLASLINPIVGSSLIWFFKFYICYLILKASYKLMFDAWKNFPVTEKWRYVIFSFICVLALFLTYIEKVELQILVYSIVMGLLFDRLLPARDKLYSVTALGVFVLFFMASLIVFGTGYMLFPYIDREFVGSGLLSRAVFDTGILLGNLSPGPVVIGATYYGWKLAGFLGALAATLGVFLGPFVLMNLLYKSLEKLRKKAIIQYLSLCMIPAIVVVLLKFNWNLIRSQGEETLRLLSLLKDTVY